MAFLDSRQEAYWEPPIYLQSTVRLLSTRSSSLVWALRSFKYNGSDSHNTKKAIIGDMWAVMIPHPVNRVHTLEILLGI